MDSADYSYNLIVTGSLVVRTYELCNNQELSEKGCSFPGAIKEGEVGGGGDKAALLTDAFKIHAFDMAAIKTTLRTRFVLQNADSGLEISAIFSNLFRPKFAVTPRYVFGRWGGISGKTLLISNI